jgi:hypothetical protein
MECFNQEGYSGSWTSPKVGYVMGYQSVGIQFVWSVLQNLMHKLPGTTFIFFLG